MDARLPAASEDIRLPGTFFAESAVKLLAKTSAGREVLDGLRDRGGVVRMPLFFVSRQEGSVARYTPPDVVFLSVQTIEAGGMSVAEFLRSPQAQLDYLECNQATIVHELKHADQARRSPFNGDTWAFLRTNGSRLAAALRPAFRVEFGMVREWEYEAYLTEHYYTHERLAADPAGAIPAEELNEYKRSLASFGDFLAAIDAGGGYSANFHGGSAYYERYMSAMRAGWDAHRLEARLLLARRESALGHPEAAQEQLAEARRLAADKGLPVPVLTLPAR
jgi:hypothetical protein